MDNSETSRKQYYHESYEQYKSVGVCPYCKKRKHFGKYVACEICLEKASIYRAAHTTTISNANKTLYQTRKALGLCTRCGQASPDGQTRCHSCRSKRNARQRQLWRRRYSPIPHDMWKTSLRANKGVCIRCGKSVLKPHKVCQEHYEEILKAAAIGRLHSSWPAEIDALWKNKKGKGAKS